MYNVFKNLGRTASGVIALDNQIFIKLLALLVYMGSLFVLVASALVAAAVPEVPNNYPLVIVSAAMINVLCMSYFFMTGIPGKGEKL